MSLNGFESSVSWECVLSHQNSQTSKKYFLVQFPVLVTFWFSHDACWQIEMFLRIPLGSSKDDRNTAEPRGNGRNWILPHILSTEQRECININSRHLWMTLSNQARACGNVRRGPMGAIAHTTSPIFLLIFLGAEDKMSRARVCPAYIPYCLSLIKFASRKM